MRIETGVFVRFGVASTAILLLIGTFSTAAFAQTSSGTITGSVFDPKQLVVTGASILIHNTDTAVDKTVTTNDAGIYVASFLPPGHYEVSADKQGFAKALRKDILVQVGDTVTINFNMTVQGAESVVTVTAEARLVETEKTEASQDLSQTLVQNLPVATRRWDSFVLLTPGVTNDGGSGLVSYRGISGLYNQNSVDGANNSQAFFGEAKGRAAYAFYTYSTDSIEEYQVSSSDYSAQYGQAAGGVVNAVTKSGTNAIHGDAFYNLRYPSLNALDPLTKGDAIITAEKTNTPPAFSVPIHQQNQFGGSVGGPILKDKLFYFATYDGERRIAPVSYTSASASSFPFTCAVISTTDCDLANSYLQGLISTTSRSQREDVYFARLDYQWNQSNRVSADFNLSNWNSPSGYSSLPTYNNSSITTNGSYTVYTRTFVTDWTSTLSNNMFNDLRFQWGRDLETAGANAPGPSVSIASVMTYGMPNALPRYAEPDEHRIQVTDVLSRIRGKHTFKFGVDLNIIHEYMANLYEGGGVYSFNGAAASSFSNWAQDLFDPTPSDQMWSTFFQVVDPITHIGADKFYNNMYAGFVEDSWKATQKLTVNFGLRYDIQVVPSPTIPNTSTSVLVYYNTRINTDKNNFGPRIGLAWQPMNNTVVRLGYGIFYGVTPASTYYAMRVENGIYQQTYSCFSPSACPNLTFPNLFFTPSGPPVAAPFPGAPVSQVTPGALPTGALNSSIVHGMTPDFVEPLVHEGELTVERQLPWNSSLSIGYLFSRGERLPVFVDGNLTPSMTTETYNLTDVNGNITQSLGPFPFYSTADANGGRIGGPGSGVILVGESIANSWYNALVLTYRKPLSNAVEMLLNYTYCNAIDDGMVAGQFGSFFGTDYPVDPFNQKRENSRSDLDQTHRFTGSIVWIPQYFNKLSNRYGRTLLNGWAISTVATVASGQPVTADVFGNPTNGLDGGLTGGVVSNSGGPPSNSNRAPWLGRNTYSLPGWSNVDLRLGKDFAITERLKLRFMAEAFNLFNETIVSGVNNTAFNYVAPGATITGANGAKSTCPAASSGTNGCLVPQAPGTTSSFLTDSTTTTFIDGARQLQFSFRLSF